MREECLSPRFSALYRSLSQTVSLGSNDTVCIVCTVTAAEVKQYFP